MARNKGQNSKANPIRKGRKGPSSTGKARNVKVDQTTWRRKLQESRIKFDDDQKQIYLTELSLHGLKGRAAEAAGVSCQTVLDHVDNDPDFAEAFEASMQSFRDSLADEIRRRGRDGWLEPVYNKDGRVFDQLVDEENLPIMRHKQTGQLVRFSTYTRMSKAERKELLEPVMVPAHIRKYSDRMLELDAKRVDPTYRDKSTVDMNHGGGGVLLAPAGMTPEEAIAEGERANAKARQERAEAEKSKGKK